jgi:hypothetical protein
VLQVLLSEGTSSSFPRFLQGTEAAPMSSRRRSAGSSCYRALSPSLTLLSCCPPMMTLTQLAPMVCSPPMAPVWSTSPLSQAPVWSRSPSPDLLLAPHGGVWSPTPSLSRSPSSQCSLCYISMDSDDDRLCKCDRALMWVLVLMTTKLED